MQNWTPNKRDLDAEVGIATAAQRWLGAVSYHRAPVGEAAYDVVYTLPHRGNRYGEIKADWASDRTGNAFFEVWNTWRNEPAGLTATRSDIWIQYFPQEGQCLVIDPKALLWYLQIHCKVTPSLNIRLSHPFSGDHNAQGYIVPLSLLQTWSWVQWMPYGGGEADEDVL